MLVKNSTFSKSFPRYAINVDDLHMDGNSYRLPQMVIDIGEHNDGYDYFYESVDDICIYPFEIIAENWDDVVDLRDDVYAIVRMTLQEELDEYVEQIRELKRVREELRDEHEIFDDMLQELENEGVLPSMRELLTPEIHDRITEDDCS
ncbi:hypothetical protein [Halovivax ruber]|uniref:hypothetical protein n=1 Tax=Halovivax ruber TaxID=387341 RepID=UPI0011E51962|nr:hypothetical protein [Halovivax ruber]